MTAYSHNKIVEELDCRPMRTFEETIVLFEEQARLRASKPSSKV
ncbi:hypothetical protein [Saccharibacillus alkalitolerans]|nr:hypothetical protein [Saccharibacillus alkalitolerans]